MEYRRFPPGESPVSTFEYHRDRERAPHLEQPIHRARMDVALQMVLDSGAKHVVDLGCGDGGMLSLLAAADRGISARGYDFAPANEIGWLERGVMCYPLDFVNRWGEIPGADLYLATEVLEHLEEPEEVVRRVAQRGSMLVASSPWGESAASIDGSHNWAWDMEGYADLFKRAGMRVLQHVKADWSQVLLAEPEKS